MSADLGCWYAKGQKDCPDGWNHPVRWEVTSSSFVLFG